MPQNHCSLGIGTYNLFEDRKDKNFHLEDKGSYLPESNLSPLPGLVKHTVLHLPVVRLLLPKDSDSPAPDKSFHLLDFKELSVLRF